MDIALQSEWRIRHCRFGKDVNETEAQPLSQPFGREKPSWTGMSVTLVLQAWEESSSELIGLASTIVEGRHGGPDALQG